ncbi:MAG: glycoside hydrolase family 130 protein [Clostridia bacterium]|nr:glycoside hydrolase family 130 protein [Clostridia bacterium]
MKQTIIGNSLPNIPWEEKPEGYKGVVWRSAHNPIIPRDFLPNSNSIFNSAAVPFENGFAGVFRVDDTARMLRLHKGKSKDGYNWELDEEPIRLIGKDGVRHKVMGYDPRVCKIEDTYYISFCNCVGGPTVALAYTKDFEDFYEIGNVLLPFNRNGVLFPRKIGGKYAMFSRPSDNGSTPFGDIFYSESPDLVHWGEHKHVMAPTGVWQNLKVGAGPVPIETTEGWLLIYHGVNQSCSGFVYSVGAAILDIDKPWKVKYRCEPYLLAPKELYECVGDVPNVVFPCAALTDAETGRIAIYYGGADTVVCLAYAQVDELIAFIKANAIRE